MPYKDVRGLANWRADHPEEMAEYRRRDRERRAEKRATDPEWRQKELVRQRKLRHRSVRLCRICDAALPPRLRIHPECRSPKAGRPLAFRPRSCHGCGTTFVPLGAKGKHCPQCAVERTRLLKRAHKAAYRQRVKAADPKRYRAARRRKYERDLAAGKYRDKKRRREMRLRLVRTVPYRAQDIYERDGWRCHLCGKAVTGKPGAMDGPSLDHLIPISKGGTDEPSNVRLAHFICNSRRGADGDVQLLLIA